MPDRLEWMPATEAQRTAILATEPHILCNGPYAGGKSEIPPLKMLMFADKWPGRDIWLLQYTADACRMMLWRRTLEWFKKYGQMSRVRNLHTATLTYELASANGAPCRVFGGGIKPAEGESNKWSGGEARLIFVDEFREVKHAELYDKSIGRSSRQGGEPKPQVYNLTNPDSPNHFAYKRWYSDPWPGHRVIEMPTIPEFDAKGRKLGILADDFYVQQRQYRGVFKQRCVDGLWVSMEGLVYPFDPRTQILSRQGENYMDGAGRVVVSVKARDSYPCVQAADPGTDHPHVHGWFRVAPEGALGPKSVWFLVKETYMTRRPITQHVRRAVEISRAMGVPLEVYYDPAAAWAAQEYQQGGYYCREAVNDRLGGQAAVNELFPHADATGEEMTAPRIYFCADSLDEVDQARQLAGKPVKTVDEFGGYIWKTSGKEDMVKEDDDGMDMMRYAVASAPHMAAPRVGVLSWDS